MPLDPAMYDPLASFKHRAIWYLKFSWLPRRCCISGKRIWLKKAYKGTARMPSLGEPLFQHEWVCKDIFLFARLQGKL